jgi:hypothetical protein
MEVRVYPKRKPSSTGSVSPPWFYEPHLQVQCDESPRLDLACGVHSTGGLRPPLMMHGVSSPEKTTAAVRSELPCKKRHSRCTNARSQERRASARRGFTNRICRCNAMNFRVSNSYTGCTPRGTCCPTFGCDCGRCCRCAILAEGKDTFPRGAYAPAPGRRYNEHPPGERRFLRCTNARSQERRASARRGSADTFTQTRGRLLGKPPTVCGPITVAIACSDTTGGLRPPLLVAQWWFAGENDYRAAHRTSLQKATFAVHERTFTRAAGVSPPWFGRYVYADTSAIARKTADSMWADHRCHRVQRYHGGAYAFRSWLRDVRSQ